MGNGDELFVGHPRSAGLVEYLKPFLPVLPGLGLNGVVSNGSGLCGLSGGFGWLRFTCLGRWGVWRPFQLLLEPGPAVVPLFARNDPLCVTQQERLGGAESGELRADAVERCRVGGEYGFVKR